MFTVRKSRGVRVLFRQQLNTLNAATVLMELSKKMPHEEIVCGTIESIVFRVMRSNYGVGNVEVRNLTHHVANLVAGALTADEISLFQSIQVEGGLKSNGVQEKGMKKVFERLRDDIPLLDSIMSVRK